MNAIEKITDEIKSIEWKINRTKRDIEDETNLLKKLVGTFDPERPFDIESIQSHTNRIAEYAKQLKTLEEQKSMLEYFLRQE